MKTLALLAVLLGSTVASAQPMPADPASDSTVGAPAEAPDPEGTEPAEAAVPQAVDVDLPPAATLVAPRAPEPRALPSLQPSPAAETENEPLGPDEYIQGGRRSAGVAFALSGGTTLAGFLMLTLAADSNDDMQAKLVVGGLLALTIGPTTGHIYAGDTWNTGLKVRLSGLGISVLGAAVALAACPPFSGNCNDGGAAIGGVGFLAGGIMYAGGTIYEIVDAPRAADRYNMKHRASIAVVPGAGGKPGMSVVGTF
jgi:hypothetical protein